MSDPRSNFGGFFDFLSEYEPPLLKDSLMQYKNNRISSENQKEER